MTTPGTRVLAGRLLVSHGMSEDAAESILRSFTAANLDIVKREPPVEPYTGDKAEEQTPAYLAERARLRAARGATTTDTEEQA